MGLLSQNAKHTGWPGLAAVAWGALACCVASPAQQIQRARDFDHYQDRQTNDAIASLSPQAQRSVKYLNSLTIPPADNWRFYPGIVDNAEAISFDDAGWKAFTDHDSRHPVGPVTIRQWVEVPKVLNGYDLAGSRIWMRLAIRAWGAEGGVTLYVNGKQVGQSDGVEPIVIQNFIQPGERLLVAAKVGTSTNDKNITPVELHVSAPASRPDPGDLYTEFVTAAVVLPSLTHDPEAKTSLEAAIADVDTTALNSGNQQKFDASLRNALTALEKIKPLLQSVTLHMTGNSHMDTAWLWPWTETVDAVQRTFGTALIMMNDHPQYTYSQSVGQYYEWMAEKYPRINAGIKQRIDDGHWELLGGMWAEPDLNMPDGESLVRQLLVGQRTMQSLYGRTTRIGWNPDSFGYNWQLPQIYKKSGLDYFVTQKLSANETNPLPMKLFWWESPDGSKVLTYLPHGYANSSLSVLRLSNDLVKARTLVPELPELMDLYGVGDHGGGPTRAVLDEGLHWMQPDKIVPKMEFGTAQSFFSKIETKIGPDSPTWNYQAMAHGPSPLPAAAAGKISIPTWRDELYFEHHRGTYTTQAQQKRNGRESEEWMLDAEKYSSLAWLGGLAYPATALTEAWKKVLINQSHDLSAGSGIGIIYKDAQRDYDAVRWSAQEISNTALQTLQARIDTRVPAGVPVLVWNSLGWQRSGIAHIVVQLPSASPEGVSVTDASGAVLPSAVESSEPATHTFHLAVEVHDVPSLGYQLLQVNARSKSFETDLRVSNTRLENSKLSVVIDPKSGCITSLFDKSGGVETLARGACGNELQTFKDTPQNDDAWNIDPGTLDHAMPITQANSVTVVEQGPTRGVVRVERTWDKSKFVQDLVLYAGSSQVDVINDIDWHESHVLLKAAFPLATTSKMATFEIPYGSIERPTTRTNSWDEAKFEVPALRWADLGDGHHGMSLLNEAKYGYDAKDNVLRLTLLRSPDWPDPVADQGHHHFSYALYPHAGDWKSAMTVERGYEYNYPLRAMQVEPHSGDLPKQHSFFALHGSHVVLTAVKKAEDSDGLVVRFYEWAGQSGPVTIDLPAGARSARLINLMEQAGENLPITGDHIVVQSHPFSIETVEIDYAPARQ